MKFFSPLSAAIAAATLATVMTAHAGEAEIRKNLAASIPQFAQIEEITKSPMPGIYEVRLSGTQIFYTDADGSYMIQGTLLDVKARKNLTEERIEKLSAIDFSKLPVKDAFKIVRGNGKRQLAVFEDPNCGYCKQFERDLATIDNITIYMFLYPVLGPDSVAKSGNIWCGKDKGKAWSDWMVRGVQPEVKECDTAAIERNRSFGQKYNITGTPTLFFADGTRTPGAIPAAQIEKQLASIK